ncbi:sacsin N-terminal ATP-binding-like domain-containing protein [Streptomyces sp. NPDC057702]|uniref:sacsin N-terminal ATP-binding-like domain-containing protein n=1 Tax=unclassified Streptomyces TaxID=2593676 RepID=UPI0036C912FE
MVRGTTGDADPFGTGRLRRGVLDAWAASPARFREDANAEEDLALGGYRDRLVIELAQNAADAAARAQVPGRLRLTLHEPGAVGGPHAGDGPAPPVLVAANNGAPLDAAGVESLSTLRASAKRDAASPGPSREELAVGRFGVGFAAVLAVSDEPAVVGRTGGVRWSLAEARELARSTAEASAELADELRRREGHVPLLRLPLPAEGRAPEGYDTVVVLPLRDGAAEDLARRLLAAIDASLLLTLPGLAEVVVETPDGVRTLRRRQDGPYVVIEDSAHESGATRWRVARDGGPLSAELLADRPVEERLRPAWSVTWAVPVDATGAPARLGGGPALPGLGGEWADNGVPGTGPARGGAAPVVHAPTPTDEPLGLPALLIASFPLEPTRRRVAPGPLTDFLVARAADAYAGLLGDWHPVTVGTLDLVPGPLGKGELDGALRRLILDQLPRVAFLPSAATAYASVDGAPADPAATGPAAAVPGAADPDAEAPADPYAEPAAQDAPGVLRPVEAEVLEGAGAETVRVLAELFPHLLPAGLERRAELRALDVGRVPLGEMIERLAGAERRPTWWRRLYDALAGTDPELLTGLPVPLAGPPLSPGAGRRRGEESGAARTTIGPRQVLLPLPEGLGADRDPAAGPAYAGGQGPAGGSDDATDAAARHHRTLARLGLKVAHPDAVHPLLEKLGATPATPRAVLTTPQVRAAVAGSLDAADDFDPYLDEAYADGDAPGGPLDADALAETVLTLVRDARLAPGDEPWLAALALPDEDGEPALAGDLVVPGSDFERVIRPGELAACDAELADRWGEETLAAVGVLAGFTLVRATDVVLDPDELEPRDSDYPEPDDVGVLDAVDVWCEDLLDALEPTSVPPVATEIVAVRDLDLVDDDAWPLALAMLSRPPLRDALTTPVRVLLPGGTTEVVRPYTAWWLRGHPVLDGRRPAGLRAAGGDPLLAGLYEAADTADVDAQVLRALGVRTSVAALLDEPGGAAELLARLAEEAGEVGPAQLRGLYGALAGLAPEDVTLPDELRAVTYAADQGPDAYTVQVVDAADALVADAPDLLPLAMAEGAPLLPVPPARAGELAELLQVRRLGEAYPAPVVSRGEPHEVAEAVRELLPGVPLAYVEHEELLVELGRTAEAASDAAGVRQVELDWRYVDGTLHAATVEGVAAGLCWAAGQWERRFEVAALLEDPTRTEELARSRWFDGPRGTA